MCADLISMGTHTYTPLDILLYSAAVCNASHTPALGASCSVIAELVQFQSAFLIQERFRLFSVCVCVCSPGWLSLNQAWIITQIKHTESFSNLKFKSQLCVWRWSKPLSSPTFSYGREGCSFLLLEANYLQSHQFPVHPVDNKQGPDQNGNPGFFFPSLCCERIYWKSAESESGEDC